MATNSIFQVNANQLNCVMFSASIWTGRARLTREDLPNQGADLPPEALASLGTKKLFDPAKLKVFQTLKQRAWRMLCSVGTQFLGGWIVSEKRLQEIDDRLTVIRSDFYSAVYDLVQDYDKSCQDWCDQFPEWSNILCSQLPDASQIERKFSFNWQFFRFEYSPEVHLNGSQNLNNAIGALPDTVMAEVSSAIQQWYEESFADDKRAQYRKPAFANGLKIVQKLQDMAFIHPELGQFAGFLDRVTQAAITTPSMIPVFRTLLKAINSPDIIRKVLEMDKVAVPVDGIANALSLLSAPAQPQPVPVTPAIDMPASGIDIPLEAIWENAEPDPAPAPASPLFESNGLGW